MEYLLAPFFIVLILSLIIGTRFSKANREESGYFLGNRSLGWFLLTMTFAATQIGGGFILGTADSAYQEGTVALFLPLGYCLGFLALGLGFGARLRSLELNTASDVFERFYGSKTLKKAASLLSITSLTGILIAQAVGLKKFLFSMGVAHEWLFLLAWFAVIIYTTQGGFLAVVWTDMVQALVMIAMLIVVFSITMGSTDAISQITDSAVLSENGSFSTILRYLLMPSLFMFIEQDMVQRCFAGKSKRDVTIAAFLSAAVLFALAIIPLSFGLIAKSSVHSASTSIFMEVVKSSTGKFITSLAASGVLLAIISTASSLLSAVSSLASQDFTTKRLSLPQTKLITFLVGFIALALSYSSSNIFACMLVSYELAISCLFVPLVIAVFQKDLCKERLASAVLSFIFGAIGFFISKCINIPILAEFLPLTLSFGGYFVGTLLKKRLVVST